MSQIVIAALAGFLLAAAYGTFIYHRIRKLNSKGESMLAELAKLQSNRFIALRRAIEAVECVDEEKCRALRTLVMNRCTISSIQNHKEQDRLFDQIYEEMWKIARAHLDFAKSTVYQNMVNEAMAYIGISREIKTDYNHIATKQNLYANLRSARLISNFANVPKRPLFS